METLKDIWDVLEFLWYAFWAACGMAFLYGLLAGAASQSGRPDPPLKVEPPPEPKGVADGKLSFVHNKKEEP
jgi:hypothetical protein